MAKFYVCENENCSDYMLERENSYCDKCHEQRARVKLKSLNQEFRNGFKVSEYDIEKV